MIHKKIVGIVAAILATTVTIITTTTFATGDEVDDMIAKYNKTTQRFNRTEVSTIISEVEEMDNGGNSGGGSGGNNGGNGGGSGGGGGNIPTPTPPPPGPTGPTNPVNQTFYDFDCSVGAYVDYGNGFTGTTQSNTCWDSLKGLKSTKSFKEVGCGFALTSFACSKVSGKAWTVGDILCTLGNNVAIDNNQKKYVWSGTAIKDWNFSIGLLTKCLTEANPNVKINNLDAKFGGYFVYIPASGTTPSNFPELPKENEKRFLFVHSNNDGKLFSSGGQHWFIIGPKGTIIYKSKNSPAVFDIKNETHKKVLNHVWEVTW